MSGPTNRRVGSWGEMKGARRLITTMKPIMKLPATMNHLPEPGPKAEATACIARGMNPKVSTSS